MSVKYEDLQYLESEKKSQRLAEDFKFQSDLQTLRTGFSNFTSNSMAEVQALNSQGGNLQEMITSLKAEVESHKQELQAARSLNDKVLSLENRLEKQLEELKAGDSEMLLQVQQLVKNLNSLTCKMDALKSNCSQNTACCPTNWLEHEGRCYWFSSLVKPWPEAEKDCQLKNAHLVVISSRDEQDFIQANLRPYFTWMGLSDQDGVWKWVDGSDYETNVNWLFSSHTNPPPPQPGIGSQASRMTFMGMGWAGVRTVPISTPMASGMTMPAKDPTAGSARLD
ncbi:C-type lectin domain family 10 member A isoform X4 [Ovis aries]|uniref:C-type lectin domain family 10 member A isoform X4 n=1 Tax=Ovis aries TaxID=9940 RepID=UPI001C2E699E|nr:C-type lectin domain family 10 member A isoform X4 [Ovis aries]